MERIEATGERRDALAQDWAAFAEACGFLPLPLPNNLPAVRELMESLPVAGVILTGGNDLASCGGDAPERDGIERELIQRSMETGIPLYGVCRGMQALLDYFKIRLQRVEGHIRIEHPLDNGDKVNSFHGWGAMECHAPLVPIAWSTDGVLEAARHSACPWIQGIMWHPERYTPFREQDIQRFREAFRL